MTRTEVAEHTIAEARRHGCITRDCGELIRRYRVPSSMLYPGVADAICAWRTDRASAARERVEEQTIVSDVGAWAELERCTGCGVVLAACRRGDIYAHSDFTCYYGAAVWP